MGTGPRAQRLCARTQRTRKTRRRESGSDSSSEDVPAIVVTVHEIPEFVVRQTRDPFELLVDASMRAAAARGFAAREQDAIAAEIENRNLAPVVAAEVRNHPERPGAAVGAERHGSIRC